LPTDSLIPLTSAILHEKWRKLFVDDLRRFVAIINIYLLQDISQDLDRTEFSVCEPEKADL
jgi:hypothetical protein